MRRQSLDFLTELMSVPTPSGFEQPGQKVVREYLSQYCDDVRTDVHGNVIGIRNPDGRPKLMLAGHIDEIGFMVEYVTDEGYIRFVAIGGVDAALLPGQRVAVHAEGGVVHGVVGKKPVHLADRDGKPEKTRIHQLWIDVGAKNKKQAEKFVTVGDPITFDVPFELLQNGLAASGGFDDKVGSFVVAEAMRLIAKRKIKPAVYCVSTVQEEIGSRGAKTSAFGIEPDAGIAVDVDHASDYPGADKAIVGDIRLGAGPVLHRGASINPVLGKMLISTAKKSKVPYQISAEPGVTCTDTDAIFLTRTGVASALVSIPTRYMHTPVEVVSLDDLANAAKLLAFFLVEMKEGASFIP